MIEEKSKFPRDPKKSSTEVCETFKLTKDQAEVYAWLKKQGLNTDDDTLNYWSRKYPAKRIIEVVNFANGRRNAGQYIRNIGGWVHKFLKTGLAVENDDCIANREFTQKFSMINNWVELHIYEKYVKDEITGDDLPLTIPIDTFKKALEALHQRSQLYKNQ